METEKQRVRVEFFRVRLMLKTVIYKRRTKNRVQGIADIR